MYSRTLKLPQVKQVHISILPHTAQALSTSANGIPLAQMHHRGRGPVDTGVGSLPRRRPVPPVARLRPAAKQQRVRIYVDHVYVKPHF